MKYINVSALHSRNFSFTLALKGECELMQLGNGLDSLRATLSSIFNLQVEPKHNQTVWWNAINLFYTGLALQK